MHPDEDAPVLYVSTVSDVNAPNKLDGVEIEFFDGWYDGPLSGVASYDGQAWWFEAAEDFDPDSTKRPLFLYPLSADELATERDLQRLFDEQARGKPVEQWPPILRERDHDLPTKYAARESVGWFLSR